MRTTVDLPDEMFRELKSLAAQRGTTLKRILQRAVERELQGAQEPHQQRIRFPLLDSSEPGTLRLSNEEIEDLLA
jgi:hypothetical protein